jgi:hypothetical protein
MRSITSNGHLHHIGIGHRWANTPVLMLIADLNIRIIATATGDLIRELTLDTSRNYQPQKPKHPQPTTEGVHDVPRHLSSMSRDKTNVGEGGLEPPRPEGHWHLKPARLPFRHSP